jgi:hypothetical protein
MKKINKNRIELLFEICSEFPKGKGAEVGTFKGEFSRDIIRRWFGTLYMIDVWRALGEEYEDASNHKYFSEGVYGDAMRNIEGFEDQAIMIRASSEIAANMFEDESLDFVYIDANHAYDFVVQDIDLWYPKVKKGGYLCGHDYIGMDWYADKNFAENGKDKHIWWDASHYNGKFGVNPAVDEFCEKYGYEPSVTNEWFGTWVVKK